MRPSMTQEMRCFFRMQEPLTRPRCRISTLFAEASLVKAFQSLDEGAAYRNLPPCYTFVGDGEPFYAETLAYVENLKKAGVEARADVYHTDMHAFDMLRDDALSREAIQNFDAQFEKALEHLRKKSEN